MNRIGLIIGYVLMFAGLYKIDSFILPTLDYFGKYVFFIMMNLFLIWSVYKVSKSKLKIAPVILGAIVFGLSFLI